MFKKILKATFEVLSRKQTSIFGATIIIMVTIALSRFLGLIRVRLLAYYFGASPELAAYVAAFRLPDTIFELLVGGAIAVAFIPVFTSFLTKEKSEEAWEIASSLINLIFFAFLLLALLVFIFTKPLVSLLAPGLIKESPQSLFLMINLTRILLLSQFFLILASFLTSILHSFQRFIVPAFASLFYNLGIIFGLLLFASKFGVYAAAIGVILGAISYFLFQLPFAFRLGFSWKPIINFSHPGVKEIGQLMLPRTVGIAANQIQAMVDLYLSSLLSAKSMVAFSFAQTLSFVPVGIFGLSLAQAILPSLSSNFAKEDKESFKNIFLTSFHQLLFLVLPLAAIFLVLRIPLVRLVFGAARFDWEATVLTGRVLGLFSLGIGALTVVPVLTRAFYALHDTATPVKIAVLTMIINALLSILSIKVLGLPVWGLALAATLAAFFQTGALLLFLSRKISGFAADKLFIPLFKIVLATFLMAIFLYIPMKLLDQLVFDTTRTINLIFLTGVAASIGFSVYLFLAWFFRIGEVMTFLNLVKKLGKSRLRLIEISQNGNGSKV